MNKFIVVLLLALVACDTDLDTTIFQQFQKFIKKYNKKYSSVKEFLARYEVFRRNAMTVLSEEKREYKTGITKFSDLTRQEFAKIYLNLNYDAMAVLNSNPLRVKVSNNAPEAFDWREKGVVSPVKNQGNCGSCYTFATVANLEGLYALNKGYILTFSEQMLVDCDTLDGGCDGGLMEYTFTWLTQNGGIMTDSDYPYVGYVQGCRADPSRYVDMTIYGYQKLGDDYLTPVDEEEIKEFLYTTAPLAVILNADPLQSYVGGILDLPSSSCPASGVNHAVTMVGYGHDDYEGKDYWIIKNSWGTNWGEDGYFRIRKGNGTCGINTYITTGAVQF